MRVAPKPDSRSAIDRACASPVSPGLEAEPAMQVKRIVANLACRVPETTADFYHDLLDLGIIVGHGWIMTLASGQMATTQLSVASEGRSGTQVPDLSIEVDHL